MPNAIHNKSLPLASLLRSTLANTSILLFMTACQTGGKSANTYRSADEPRPLVDSKYSLSADRAALEEMRKDVPEEKKQENDELAYLLKLTEEVKRPPSEIRTQFDSVLRKKRELFNKDLKKEREV